MNKRPLIAALAAFTIAFFAPIWSVAIALSGTNSDTQQYGGIQTAVMGVFNLLFVIPSLVFLLIGRKKQSFYTVSIALSICSIAAMCVWAFGASS